MIHPDTKLKWVSKEIGYGVFATKLIPKGTAIYVRDQLEIVVERDSQLLKNEAYSEIVKKYSYVDAKGDYVLSWDHGRYVNHCCFPNTITTGYGFEIAIRDIAPGEEITDDYGLLNLEEDIPLACGKEACRGTARAKDFEAHADRWDTVARESLAHFYLVDQPLLKFFDRPILAQLNGFLETGMAYLSVRSQRFVEGSNAPEFRYRVERKRSLERSE
ncbi:MAG: SET domain-containing protein [Proteobacteria bacterium]|nr:SET domain-containing protein [Pseudomonadota bacterium]